MKNSHISDARDLRFTCEYPTCEKEANLRRKWNLLFVRGRTINTARKFCSEECKTKWYEYNKKAAKIRVEAWKNKMKVSVPLKSEKK